MQQRESIMSVRDKDWASVSAFCFNSKKSGTRADKRRRHAVGEKVIEENVDVDRPVFTDLLR